MVGLLTFEQLWEKVNASSNGIYYHLCCDVWTTRSSKAKRASHIKFLQWRKIMASLDKNMDDKKQALLAKMTEEGWRNPVVVNQVCQTQPATTVPTQFPFRLHNQSLQPQDLHVRLVPTNFTLPDPHYTSYNTLGTSCLYQALNLYRLLLFQSKVRKCTFSSLLAHSSDLTSCRPHT